MFRLLNVGKYWSGCMYMDIFWMIMNMSRSIYSSSCKVHSYWHNIPNNGAITLIWTTITWFTNLPANHESKYRNYGRFWAIGHFERIANSKNELTGELCYTNMNNIRKYIRYLGLKSKLAWDDFLTWYQKSTWQNVTFQISFTPHLKYNVRLSFWLSWSYCTCSIILRGHWPM